jgi:PAS domain-containing protein
MSHDRDILSHIEALLKSSPRGMNVIDIASEIGMNRQSVARYLDILTMSGHADKRTLGTSNIYYPSQRIPVLSILDLLPWPIAVLNHRLNFIFVNDPFLNFGGVKKEDLLNKSFHKFSFPYGFTPSITPKVEDALNGTASAVNAQYANDEGVSYFNVRLLPLVLDDGEKGTAIMFEDITDGKRY